jgi:arylsulfatase A-like enzyme
MSVRNLKLLLFTALILACLTAVVVPVLRAHRPPGSETGLVLIIVDTLRADRLGAYGYDRATSPNIDQVAARGVVFEQAIANCSWTRPSIASMLTGTYPRETGVYKERFDALSPDVVTLAEMFSDAGWSTYGVTSNPSVNTVFGFHRGFDEYGDCGVVWPWMKGKRRFKRNVVLMEDADLVTDRSISLMERHEGGPFYLQVLYIDPHLPYGPPETFDHPLARDARTISEKYDAEIAFADEEIGRLVSWIRLHYPDTWIVVTSDHGEGLGDHPGVGRASTHGFTLYDSVLHVPLVFDHPSVPAGARFPDMVQLLDLVPTFADLFDLGLDPQASGVSLAPILRGEPPPLLADQIFSDTQFNEVDKVSVREIGAKLVLNRDHDQLTAGDRPDLDKPKRANMKRAIEQCGPAEYYLLPGHENPVQGDHDLVDDPDHAGEVERLREALVQWEARTNARPPINRDSKREIDSTVIQQLKALGYLEE